VLILETYLARLPTNREPAPPAGTDP
jgi:hypothetical protein